MADFHTPNYDLTEPEVGSSSGTWGNKLNTGIGLVDRLLALPKPVTAVSTTGVLDLTEALIFSLVTDADKTVSFTNVPVAEVSGNPDVATFVWLFLVGSGVSHTVTYPGSVTWADGIAPQPFTTADLVVSVLLVTYDEGTTWHGHRIGYFNDLSVATSHIQNLAVTTAKLAADAVTNAKLADNAVQNENILDGTIAQAKLAFSVQTSPEIPVHVSQAFYDGSSAAVQGILNVMASVGVIEIS